MNDKPEIEKLRVLHELQNQFSVPDAVKKTLEAQLSNDDQNRIKRFVAGFKIEDWFEWTFSAMPWALLIHGLNQQQFPAQSKHKFQVPDFLMIVETTALTHQPLLVEVKRVPHQKQTIKIQGSQFALCENYASALNVPIVYAIYWEKFNGWTLNTPDIFERKSSNRKLPMLMAFELDCGLILGDVSYFVPRTLTRISGFDEIKVDEPYVRHDKYGRMVSDVAILGEKKVTLNSLESGAIDSMLTMKTRDIKRHKNRTTEIVESPEENYMLKLSSWITRHLMTFNITPTEEHSNVSAHVISELMEKLGCPAVHIYPSKKTDNLKNLESLFFAPKTAAATNKEAKKRAAERI